MGVGSAALALGVAAFPGRFTLRARWLVFAAVILLGTLALPFVGSVTAMTVTLGLIGIGVGPTLVTQYSIGARRSPAGRSTTVMTILGAAVIAGQSVGAAVTGEVAERFGTVTALSLPMGAAVIAVAAGVANWFVRTDATGQAVGSSPRSRSSQIDFGSVRREAPVDPVDSPPAVGASAARS
jgi:MFS family permease